MCRVGPLGVKESLYGAVSAAAVRIGQGGITATEAHTELPQLLQNSPRYADWVVAVAVGVACAAKGNLGLFAVISRHSTAPDEILIAAMDSTLRVTFYHGVPRHWRSHP